MAGTELVNLPTETLTTICKNLCYHCEPGTLGWYEQGEDNLMGWQQARKNRSGLVSLCRTSRLFHQIATPILYHRFAGTKVVPLIRTLLQYPERALGVRHIDIEDSWSPDLAPEDRAKVVQSAEVLGIDLPDTFASGEGEEEEQMCILSDLLLAKVTNLERFSTKVGYDIHVGRFWPPGATWPSLRSISASHIDTEGGFDLDELSHLFKASPNLAKFHGHMCISAGPGLALGNLTHLSFTYTHMGVEDLNNVISACPKLEHFYFESDDAVVMQYADSEKFTPRQAAEALRRCPKLKHVSIDLTMAFGNDEWEEDSMIDHLRGLDVLENLDLSLNCVYVETDDDSTTDGSLLVNIIPKSIKRFTLNGMHSHIFGDVLEFAESARRGKYPSLEEVQFSRTEGDEEEWESIQGLFSSAGVSCNEWKLTPESTSW